MSWEIALIHEAGFSARLAKSIAAFSVARGFRVESTLLSSIPEGERFDSWLAKDGAIFLFDSKTDEIPSPFKWLLEPQAREILLPIKLPVAVLGVGEGSNKMPQRMYSMLVCGGSEPADVKATYISETEGAEAFSEWMVKTWDQFAAHGLVSQFPMKYMTINKEHPSPSVKPTRFSKATVVKNELLTHPDYARPSYMTTLDFEGSDLRYEPGDHVIILPENKPENVDRVLKALRLNSDEVVEVLDMSGNKVDQIPSLGQTVRDLFRFYIDIQGLASRNFIASLSFLATKEADALALRRLALGFEKGSEYATLSRGILSTLDVVEKFPSVEMTAAQALSIFPLQRHRSYSAASSPLANGHHVQLVFTVLSFPTPDGKTFVGTNTGYMQGLKPGDEVSMSIRKSSVKLELDDPHTCYMGVALGSGVAMLRGIAQHLSLARQTRPQVGKMLLYYGVRHQAMDYMFGADFAQCQQDGVLQLFTAFSHDQAEFITPAHRMREDPEALCKFLVDDEHCRFFYCGPSGPAYSSIETGIKDAIRAARPTVQPEEHLAKMKAAGRWEAQAYTPGADPENPFRY